MIQAGFFVAPIIYPLGIVPERFHFYFYLWPPTPIIEFSRAALVSHTVPSLDRARVPGDRDGRGPDDWRARDATVRAARRRVRVSDPG